MEWLQRLQKDLPGDGALDVHSRRKKSYGHRSLLGKGRQELWAFLTHYAIHMPHFGRNFVLSSIIRADTEGKKMVCGIRTGILSDMHSVDELYGLPLYTSLIQVEGLKSGRWLRQDPYPDHNIAILTDPTEDVGNMLKVTLLWVFFHVNIDIEENSRPEGLPRRRFPLDGPSLDENTHTT